MARQGLAYPPGGEGSEGFFHHDFITWSCRRPLGCGRSQKQSQAKRGASSLSLPSAPPPPRPGPNLEGATLGLSRCQVTLPPLPTSQAFVFSCVCWREEPGPLRSQHTPQAPHLLGPSDLFLLREEEKGKKRTGTPSKKSRSYCSSWDPAPLSR